MVSPKAGIFSSHANELDEQLVFHSLENMLTGCESQVNCLNGLYGIKNEVKGLYGFFRNDWKAQKRVLLLHMPKIRLTIGLS